MRRHLMSPRNYLQIFGDVDDDEGWSPPHAQTAEDDWRIAATPALIRSGTFRVYYRSLYSSNFITEAGGEGSRRTLLSVDAGVDGVLEFYVYNSSGGGATSKVVARLDGVVLVEKEITFSALQEMSFTFDAEAGTVTVSGATTGDGTATGDPWDVADGELRMGGHVTIAGKCARGWVTYPYAVL
jgi:hypothetical protein